MPLNKIERGRPFPGGTFDTLVDIARKEKQGGGPIGFAGRMRWHNVSGTEAPKGAIIRITDVMQVDNEIVLEGDQPDISYQRHGYAVSLDVVDDDKIGECTLLLRSRAYYLDSDGTPAFGEYWGVEPGEWYLRKMTGDPPVRRPSFMIVGYPDGTGTDARVTVLPTPWVTKARKIHFSLTEDLGLSDSSATISIVRYYDGVDPDPDGGGASVWNAQGMWSAESDKKGGASYDPESDKYWIDWLEC